MKLIRALLLLFLPTWLVKYVCVGKNIHIGKNTHVGFSLILTDSLAIGDDSVIGHFNLIKVKSLKLGKKSSVGFLNILKGNFKVELGDKSCIHQTNKITNSADGLDDVCFSMGNVCYVNVGHVIDLSDSLRIEDGSILAGCSTQIWTHGWYYGQTLGQAKICSPVSIGKNVYVGSRCCITPGVNIADNITIGAQTTISKSLDKSGCYVSQPVRFIEYNPDEKIKKLGEPIKGNIYKKG